MKMLVGQSARKGFLRQETMFNAIKLFNDLSSLMLEAKEKALQGEGLKLLTPKQMLQTLPITFTQVKAGNTSKKQNRSNNIFCLLSKKNYYK